MVNSFRRNAIFGAYHDADPSECGNIRYAILGAYPCRTFVFNYDAVCQYSCTNTQTTQQIVLYETTNAIEVYIQNKPSCGVGTTAMPSSAYRMLPARWAIRRQAAIQGLGSYQRSLALYAFGHVQLYHQLGTKGRIQILRWVRGPRCLFVLPPLLPTRRC